MFIYWKIEFIFRYFRRRYKNTIQKEKQASKKNKSPKFGLLYYLFFSLKFFIFKKEERIIRVFVIDINKKVLKFNSLRMTNKEIKNSINRDITTKKIKSVFINRY